MDAFDAEEARIAAVLTPIHRFVGSPMQHPSRVPLWHLRSLPPRTREKLSRHSLFLVPDIDRVFFLFVLCFFSWQDWVVEANRVEAVAAEQSGTLSSTR